MKVCFICGSQNHTSKLCHQKYCTNCFSFGHFQKNCNSKNRCSICGIVGHIDDKCTFHWRKYSTITNPNDLILNDESNLLNGNGKVNNNISCFNCGSRGHFGHVIIN